MNNDFWNKRYTEPEYSYGMKPNEYFREKISKLTPGKLLLLAEGEGRNAVFAAKLGWQVTAVDFSQKAKEKAVKLAKDNNVNLDYLVQPLENFDFPENKFDAVSLIFAHFPEAVRKVIHVSAVKSLKPGGHIIIEAFEKKQINNNSGGPKDISVLYSLNELADDFKSARIEEISELTIELNEGKYHSGKSEVIRLFAMKK